MNFFKRQIHFVASTRKKAWIGIILCLYLSFIIIFLEPFDTSQFEAEYKTLLLSGYGILAGIVFIIQSCFENILYKKQRRVWVVSNEISSALLFCFLAGTMLCIYNVYIVNVGKSLTIGVYNHFIFITTVRMIPVIVRPMVYLRQRFGERIVPPAKNSVVLVGENKNEILKMEKDDLLFVKAVENYVEICFVDKSDKVISKTFRQTLSNVGEQLPYLKKCHRSYLVNINSIKQLSGNSQGAKILFSIGEKEIPLSKTYYKDIKNRLI